MIIELQNIKYHIGKLNAFIQQDMLVDLIPIITPILSAKMDKNNDKESVGLLINEVSKLPRAKQHEIRNNLLSVVSRDLGKGLGQAPIISNGELMYDDIGLKELLKLQAQTLKHNFSDFFQSLPSNLVGQKQEQKTQ